jgi:hypothetical protein
VLLADPNALLAVTFTRTPWPISEVVARYVDPLAPLMGVQARLTQLSH